MRAASPYRDIQVIPSRTYQPEQEIEMARMATRIASGLAAAGIATLMSTAPAQARAADPEAGGTGAAAPAAPARLPRRPRRPLG